MEAAGAAAVVFPWRSAAWSSAGLSSRAQQAAAAAAGAGGGGSVLWIHIVAVAVNAAPRDRIGAAVASPAPAPRPMLSSCSGLRFFPGTEEASELSSAREVGAGV